jgi:hypothetical protein
VPGQENGAKQLFAYRGIPVSRPRPWLAEGPFFDRRGLRCRGRQESRWTPIRISAQPVVHPVSARSPGGVPHGLAWVKELGEALFTGCAVPRIPIG